MDHVQDYVDRFQGSPFVSFISPVPDNAGAVTLCAAFDPQQNAFSAEQLQFTYYDEPEITEVRPAACGMKGGDAISLAGIGLVPSDDIKIRLTVVLEEADGGKDKKVRIAAALWRLNQEQQDDNRVFPFVRARTRARSRARSPARASQKKWWRNWKHRPCESWRPRCLWTHST